MHHHLPSPSSSCCPQAQWLCPFGWLPYLAGSCAGSTVTPAPGVLETDPVVLQQGEMQSGPGAAGSPLCRGGKGSRGEFSYSSLTFSLACLPKMLTMSTLKYVKLFYRLYRKDCHPPCGGLLASFLQRSIPCTLPGSSRPHAPGRVGLSLPVSPPSLLCFPAAAALPPTAEGQSHPSHVSVCVRLGRLNSLGLSGCPVRNDNEVRELSKKEESHAEGLSNS